MWSRCHRKSRCRGAACHRCPSSSLQPLRCCLLRHRHRFHKCHRLRHRPTSKMMMWQCMSTRSRLRTDEHATSQSGVHNCPSRTVGLQTGSSAVEELGAPYSLFYWLSNPLCFAEYPDIVDPALISGPCSICMERAPAARVHWRPNVCGHLQVCDGCMAAGPDSTRVDIRAPGDWLTANNTVRSQFVYAHEQRPARRSTGVQCVQNGCDNVQCGHWQLLADGQEHGLECEVCKKYFGAYVREEHVPPPSRPSTPQA
jgi:hypothetical protein